MKLNIRTVRLNQRRSVTKTGFVTDRRLHESLRKFPDSATAPPLVIDADEIILAISAEKSGDEDEKGQWINLANQKQQEINVPDKFKPDGSPRRRKATKK